ncbi:hypothetical protein K469DRAFT_683372 [Zopfia rhizophila CBS 207.26]|uniref:Extracellular membrane protein CFEM domain-containing protein n=1 Tax=Zopfia rhizophila CBS 207.26 TaxID=1314779 RepID=A0A6A6DBQ4_9PEZI|nr:hypothetical protein K469DRAFT_683372 [Zopfia rhizophila CBS 207.26]
MKAFILSLLAATALAAPGALTARDASCKNQELAACCNKATGLCDLLTVVNKCQQNAMYCCDFSGNNWFLAFVINLFLTQVPHESSSYSVVWVLRVKFYEGKNKSHDSYLSQAAIVKS